MATAAEGRIPKPVMRGLGQKKIYRMDLFSALGGVIGAIIFNRLPAWDRRKKTAEYLENRDPEKEFREMREANVFKYPFHGEIEIGEEDFREIEAMVKIQRKRMKQMPLESELDVEWVDRPEKEVLDSWLLRSIDSRAEGFRPKEE